MPGDGLSEDRKRELMLERWEALRAAARATHKDGAGGQAHCICGASCGGSPACSMFLEFMYIIQYMPRKGLSSVWADKLDFIRDAIT